MGSRLPNNKTKKTTSSQRMTWVSVAMAVVTLVSGCIIAQPEKPGKDLVWFPLQDIGWHPVHHFVPSRILSGISGDIPPNTDPRLAAYSQGHRTPRIKPPVHDFMTKPLKIGFLTSGHGYRVNPTGKHEPRRHNGIDYAAPVGTPVYAAGDGVIVVHYHSDSYGNYLRIKHGDGFSTAYAHLKSFKKGIRAGKRVERGQIIGYVGSTGRSTGPHLHFELIYKGKFIDPLFKHQNTAQTGEARNPNSG